MAISHSPSFSPSPSWVNRQMHKHSSRRDAFVDNALFIVSVVLFTMALLTAAFTFFSLCFKRLRRRRPPLESRGSSVDLPSLPQRKPVAESFPEFVYEFKNYGDQGLECAVCLSEFEEEEKGRILPACNHSFHVDCIDKWLNSHSTCPLCRVTAGVDMTLGQ